MNALVLALLRPQGRLEIKGLRLLMLFSAIRGGASGFVSMDAVEKSAVIAQLETKVADDEEHWTGFREPWSVHTVLASLSS